MVWPLAIRKHIFESKFKMYTSTDYVSGTLTLVAHNGESFDIGWDAPLHDETFNSVTESALEHSTTFVTTFGLPLRDYLAEKVLDAYMSYAMGTDDDTDPANIEADNELKVWLKLFAGEVGSPNLTFCVSGSGVEHISVEPLPDPEELWKVLSGGAMMLASVKNAAKVP
jgi:hypothetical protein